MDKNIEIVNAVIQALDQLQVQGARNMSMVLQCIQHLGELRENLSKEAGNVQDQAE